MKRSPVWRPFTQHAAAPPAVMVARAEGAWLETAEGERILDAISSWWVVTHGHRHPRIVDAIQRQAETLDQVIFAGCTHEAAERLACELIAIAPKGLAHVFYSDSGSTAVEVALKMAVGYWRNTGAPRTRILALEHAYHGDTVGAMSAGARGVFNASYEPLLFDVTRIPFPAPGDEQPTIDALDRECRKGGAAALIVESLILGAGGMLPYAASALAEMKRVCERHDVLFVADEVMTGWGRTGTLFACEQACVTPDILCVAKGLTGGSLPLAATLCAARIFDAHYSTDRTRTFFHSSSYTANPIACAAALANIEVWKAEPVMERVRSLAGRQRRAVASLRGDNRVQNARSVGTIAAFEVEASGGGYLSDVGPRIAASCLRRGVLVRPLGNTVYVMPPYCIDGDELARVYDAVGSAIDDEAV